VAGALRALGELHGEMGHLDEREFLFRRRFRCEQDPSNAMLVLDGLATLADVWLNGACLLSSRNMFRRYSVDAAKALRRDNELVVHFRALAPELSRKRPRGRWTTRLVKHRNLRFLRTSLLGRTPGWGPAYPAVGPWRTVRLVHDQRVRLRHVSLTPSWDGANGVLGVVVKGDKLFDIPATALHLRLAGHRYVLPITGTRERFEAAGEMRVGGVSPWWPHDIGTPQRYPVTLSLECGGETAALGSVQVGFRRVERVDADGFGLRLNGRDIFAKGACWMPADPAGFADDAVEIRRVLELVRDAGLNMVRISGTTFYESNAFYDACDELGILVWHDFMFARMDYPDDDPAFVSEAQIEAEQALASVHHRPCLAVLCGNSEVEQQAAMMGLGADAGKTPLFCETLADASRRWCPGVPYVTSSPTGGALPFHVDSGVAHYFGVGAYLRPLSDARESAVRFASECLAFSNVPEDDGLDELFGEEARVAHSPRYKAGVPRDSGAGWDFADVTDHYLEQFFACRAREQRYSDMERYFALARVTPGEAMTRAMGIWRAAGSSCRGALIWLLRDLQAGAGCGILDSAGRPKAAYWFLKRACAPQAAWFTDEGLNGLRLHVGNDRPEAMTAALRLRLLRSDGVETAGGGVALRLEPHSARSIAADALIGRFTDATWAYRFGPCPYAVAVAELTDASGALIAVAHYFPAGVAHEVHDDIGLRATARPYRAGYHLRIETRALALFVRINAPGFQPSDNYFHLAPNGVREVDLLGPTARARIQVGALNVRSLAAAHVAEA
jgi:beta-mannosidase